VEGLSNVSLRSLWKPPPLWYVDISVLRSMVFPS
jgi:hypothetical protein